MFTKPFCIPAGSFWLSCTLQGITCTFIACKHNTMMMMKMVKKKKMMIIILDIGKLDQTYDTKFHVSCPYIPKGILLYFKHHPLILKKNQTNNDGTFLQNVSVPVWAWCDTLLSHMVGPTRRSSPVGIAAAPPHHHHQLTELFTAQMERDSGLQLPSWLNQGKDGSCMCRFSSRTCNHWLHSSCHGWRTGKS